MDISSLETCLESNVIFHSVLELLYFIYILFIFYIFFLI